MAKAKRENVTAGAKGKVQKLKGTYANKEEADRASKAKMAEIKYQMAKFSITTAFGIPSISTETPMNLDGFKPQMDKLKWIVEKATHSYYSTSGLAMQLKLEATIE